MNLQRSFDKNCFVMNNIVILDCSIPSSIKERSLEFSGIAFLSGSLTTHFYFSHK
jgi:hypothetical protein